MSSYQPRHSIYPTSSSSSHHPSSSISSSSTQSSALQSRIAAKRAELQNLQELRTLSATLASQMASLEAKLATLRDGTEAVACVMANWEGVLKAISMAGAKGAAVAAAVKVEEKNGDEAADDENKEREMELPRTLVRIPVGQQLQVQTDQQQEGGGGQAVGEGK